MTATTTRRLCSSVCGVLPLIFFKSLVYYHYTHSILFYYFIIIVRMTIRVTSVPADDAEWNLIRVVVLPVSPAHSC